MRLSNEAVGFFGRYNGIEVDVLGIKVDTHDHVIDRHLHIFFTGSFL